MDGMLPVWDFSVPELEQLQAEQAELSWNPLPDVTDADIQATIGLPSLPSSSALAMPDGGGVSTTRSSGQREDDSWEPSSSAQQAKVTNRRQAAINAARQDSFPTPSPADNYVQDDMEEPSQRQRTGSSDNSERSKAVNRESQRRFRLRQKARSQAVEAQLASTTAELRELKSRQHQLEVRNMLLEKVSQLNKSTDPQSSSEDQSPHDAFDTALKFEENDVDNVALLTVSVQGKQYSTTPHEVSQMPLQSFSALWTVYVCELGRCLLKLKDSSDPVLERRMRELTVEAISLVGHRLLRNPASHKDLATGQMNQDQAKQHKLDAKFYKNLLGLLALTDDQLRDLMLMRQLYLTKRGLLAMERKALVNQMGSNEGSMPHPSDNITKMADLATCLKENAAEDHHVHRKVARAVYRGVLTTKQLAEMMVHCYPYMPSMEPFIHNLAAETGYPIKEDVVAAAQTNHMTTEWRQFSEYAKYAATEIFHEHVPFLKRRPGALGRNASLSFQVLPADRSQYVML
ncbi:TPA: hypothetical protein ACH3X3_004483 [Trebouxia sp. C0006]